MEISNTQNTQNTQNIKNTQNIENKIKKYLERLTKLVIANSTLIKEKKLLEDSKSVIEKELNDLKKQHSILEEKLTKKIEEYEKNNEVNKETENNIEKLISTSDKLTSTILELQQQNNEKELQLSLVNSEKKVLQEKIVDFKKEIEQLNLKNTNNENKIQELTEEINSLTAKNNLSTKTSEELQTIKINLEEKQKEIYDKDNIVKFLNDQINELEQKSEEIYNKYLQNNGLTETVQAETQNKILKAAGIEKEKLEVEKKQLNVLDAFKKSDTSTSSESLVKR